MASQEDIDTFTSITGATAQQATVYIELAAGDPMQAIQLFFDSPDLAAAATAPAPSSPPPRQLPTADDEVIDLANSDDEMDVDSDDVTITGSRRLQSAPDVDADAEMARRLQEEMYAGGHGADSDGVRAPIQRTRETLVGGPDDSDFVPHLGSYMPSHSGFRANRNPCMP